MKHFHPHHLSLQMMQELAGQFDESSPLRKLFKTSMEYEYTIEMILQGPVHESVNMLFILKACEGILNTIQREGVEIKPITDGLPMKSHSPHLAEMTLPLQFPKSILEATAIKIDASMFLGEGPIERTLANTLIVSVLYYFDLYFQTKKERKYHEKDFPYPYR